ncbi:MAG TPA: T9SS type A sorting domain-containing protein, partial [Candidatus Cloacimonadota bacterium]|nr:T9SS type A sorting domain-containing protein [Candidatus Cloacimonadota bacterium]
YIDDLVVYSRDLDSNEIHGLLMGTIPAENLEHYFRFNEGSGLATLDQKSGLSSILNGSYSWVESEPPTLPVELSSFTGFTTSDGKATLTWITQSEANLSGYYLLRSQESELESSLIVSPLIEAHNLPTEQHYSFKDNEVEPGIWHYWLEVNELDGSIRYYGDDNTNPEIPQKHGLISISPNPFNPNTRILYNIRKARTVELQIYNHRGQLIQILKHHHSEPGQYQAFWDGKDAGGNDQGSGLYLCRLIAGEDSSVMKMVLMK